MTDLVIGPLLRYVGENCAVIWVETSGPCEVTVMGCTEPTFHVEGHHFALVRIDDLEPGTAHEYTVELDGQQVWPREGSGFPPMMAPWEITDVIRYLCLEAPLALNGGRVEVFG